MENNKKIYIIMTIIIGIILIAGTYAWLSWRSKDTKLVLTVGDIDDAQVILKPYQLDLDILPVLTYEGEDYVSVSVVNNSSNSKIITLNYYINNIDQELISSNFKYTITKSSDGTTFNEYITNNFSEASNNSEINILEEEVDSNTSYQYRIYIWLDGSDSGQGNIQGKNFNGEIKATIENNIPTTFSGTIYRYSTDWVSIGDSIQSVSYVTDPTSLNKSFYLKHIVENDIITESYVGFIVTPEMAEDNQGMTAGTYYLKGGDSGAAYEDNKTVLLSAFGSSYCSKTNRFGSSIFDCDVYGLNASAYSYGYVNAIDGAGSYCNVFDDGVSYCG